MGEVEVCTKTKYDYWEYIWWDNNNCDKRIAVIGDTVLAACCGGIAKASKVSLCTDMFATTRTMANPFYIEDILRFIEQQEQYDFVLFNSGIYCENLYDEEYRKYYKAVLKKLLDKKLSVAIVLTTPVQNNNVYSIDNAKIHQHNEIAGEIAAELNISIIDIYSKLVGHSELYKADGIHLTEAGCDTVAQKIADALTKMEV